MNRTFASDNCSGVCPEVMVALAEANQGHVSGYGDDPYTKTAKMLFTQEFGEDSEVYFVYNGTAANVLALRAMTRSHHSIVCSEHAHILVNETGAVQTHTGCKMLSLPSRDGKIRMEQVRAVVEQERYWGHHATQPRVLSITQPTEFGAIYTPEEIRSLADDCHELGLLLHVDGCRIFNAAVACGISLRGLSRDLGVDVLSLGGTKNGLMFGEAIVFFRRDLAEEFRYVHKQGLQLASKMRFLAAQYIPFLRDGVWRKNAQQANDMAMLLGQGLAKIPGIRLLHPIQTNQIFAIMPVGLREILQQYSAFYTWNEPREEVRLVTSFDHTPEDLADFLRVAEQYAR